MVSFWHSQTGMVSRNQPAKAIQAIAGDFQMILAHLLLPSRGTQVDILR